MYLQRGTNVLRLSNLQIDHRRVDGLRAEQVFDGQNVQARISIECRPECNL